MKNGENAVSIIQKRSGVHKSDRILAGAFLPTFHSQQMFFIKTGFAECSSGAGDDEGEDSEDGC